jgi:hypothetical protein
LVIKKGWQGMVNVQIVKIDGTDVRHIIITRDDLKGKTKSLVFNRGTIAWVPFKDDKPSPFLTIADEYIPELKDIFRHILDETNGLDLIERKELQSTRDRAEKMAERMREDKWRRSYLSLADAADHLDALLYRGDESEILSEI